VTRPSLHRNDMIGGGIKRAPEPVLQTKRRMTGKHDADEAVPARDVNSDGVAFSYDVGLLTHEIAEFSVHRLSPSVFGIEGYGQGVSIPVTSELADHIFFEAVQRVQKLRLQEQGRMAGERQFNAGLPAFQCDEEGITGPAFNARTVFNKTNAVQLLSLSGPLSPEGSPKHAQVKRDVAHTARIIAFIALLPALQEQRFNVHISRHFAQLGRVRTQSKRLRQFALTRSPLSRPGHFNNSHKTASLRQTLTARAGQVMAETKRVIP
jgi:hypothetical protein